MFTKAAKRAYLGCYYLSSSLATAFHKPNGLQYNDLMEAYGHSLLRDEVPSDIVLWSLVKLQRFTNKAREFLSSSYSPKLDTEIQIQTHQNEVQEWRRSTSKDIATLCMWPTNNLFSVLTDHSSYHWSRRSVCRNHYSQP